MSAPIKLQRQTPAKWGQSQASLYAEAVNEIQQLGHQHWTDHNIHDPGITLLEVLAYGLSETAFRTALPMADLLAEHPEEKTVYRAREILPNRALTVLDYRKLLIDLPGVRNAWFSEHPLTLYLDTRDGSLSRTAASDPWIEAVSVRGLFDVLLDHEPETDQSETEKLVHKTLMQNRSLAQDFISISAVPEQGFRLCAELEVAPEIDVNELLAQIYFTVQNYLAPVVNNYTYAELEHRFSAEALFNGPRLRCGFIFDEELLASELRTELRLSDIYNLLMDLPGLTHIREAVITDADTAKITQPWLVPVKPQHKPTLNLDGSRVVIYKRHVPIQPNLEKVKLRFLQLMAELRQKNETPIDEDLPLPQGVQQQVERYVSIQTELPQVYGIGSEGLPANADQTRQRDAHNLSAFISQLEQLPANFLMQLKHLALLYSTRPEQEATTFFQALSTGVRTSSYHDADPVAAMRSLQNISHERERRHRFLDHLSARLGESFAPYASMMQSHFSAHSLAVAADKCYFLQDYPTLSYHRAGAYEYSAKQPEDIWNSENVSGLERRIARLLGIRNYRRRSLSEVAYDIYAEIDTTPDDEFRFRVLHRVSGKILLSSSKHYVTKAEAIAEMQLAIHYAQQPESYQRKLTSDNRHYFNIVDETDEVLARRIEYFNDENAMEEAISGLMQYLQEHYAEEGFYLIENLLLLPPAAFDEFLTVCVDNACTPCADHDPYSYRVHFVFPAFAGRFTNMAFRDYVESVVRAETPAHLLPKICWLDQATMAAFENVYRDWLEIKSGAKTAQAKQKWRAMLDALIEMKSVYPTERLRQCSPVEGTEVQEKFIVGRTSLGSSDSAE
ncbi:diguanylate cyclase [Permianibacter aggregans]|uniref:Uncharacterized protein n=1 Tax=Permianibacter aggregans TaxID=1510150 RepID=A0A4R6US04_9GAMM|nr:diguanylate cyclase [Permianibacter aggregans]QGX41012.1 diguanylate cyclase [Permianibacter aggregans]TDQ48075.1 hypothetical protein EV696_10855 [Permianibacter aggregans]